MYKHRLRELLRLIFHSGLTDRQIGRAVACSHNTVKRYKASINQKGLSWSELNALDDEQIDVLFNRVTRRFVEKRMPDWLKVHEELQEKGVTLELLWEEYRLANPEDAYSYSQFTHLYRDFVNKLDVSMRQIHRPGEVVFVDFAGKTVSWYDDEQACELHAQIFVGCPGYSNYTFAYAVASQSTEDFIAAHVPMFDAFGGVPQVVVVDNLKAAVITAGRNPKLNRAYAEFANHYGFTILPARVRHPKDKAKAEVAVQVVTRWILARLRKRKFFSLDEINEAIAELLPSLNERPFRRLPGCRRSRFEEFDKLALQSLPESPYEYGEWLSSKKVPDDYHIEVNGHYYSVPCRLKGESVEARVSRSTVEIFLNGRRIASHAKNEVMGGHSTDAAHQPASHRAYANRTPEKFMKWARAIGEATYEVVSHQFEDKASPIRGMNACDHLKRLQREYGDARLESACRRAIDIHSLTVKSVRSILQRGLDRRMPNDPPTQASLPFHHPNVRGAQYYGQGGN